MQREKRMTGGYFNLTKQNEEKKTKQIMKSHEDRWFRLSDRNEHNEALCKLKITFQYSD